MGLFKVKHSLFAPDGSTGPGQHLIYPSLVLTQSTWVDASYPAEAQAEGWVRLAAHWHLAPHHFKLYNVFLIERKKKPFYFYNLYELCQTCH